MSVKILKEYELKPHCLFLTGRQCYGLDEYIYIKTTFIEDDKKVITISFYCFLKNNDGEYIVVPNKHNNNKGLFQYYVEDGVAFMDSNGFFVYSEDEWGDITRGMFRLNDYSIIKNIDGSVKEYVIEHIKNWMGYHENEGGLIDELDMFGDYKKYT